MKIHTHAILKLMAVLMLALLLVIAALPASSSHTCVAGSDDYDQCIANTTPGPSGSSPPPPTNPGTGAGSWQ